MFENSYIKYIGADDHDLDLFESQYPLAHGVSYNSYVILDEKTVVMDTIDVRKTEEWLKNLEKALNGRTADYLVISHMEPDHAANIQKLCAMYPDLKLVATMQTFNMLPNFFDIDRLAERKIVVKEAQTLPIGKNTLQFFMAPMVHWPEVMMTYVPEEKLLFSADAFGKFGTIDHDDDWVSEARRYYANIVGKYGVQVQNTLKKLAGLDVETICPLHGPILTDDLGRYLDLYNKWSSYTPEEDGVLIACASIYGHTEQACEKLADLLKEQGKKVEFVNLNRVPVSEAIGLAFKYSSLVLAASSYDAAVFPSMELFLLELSHKNFQNRKIALMENGSWAPTAAKTMMKYIEQMKNITLIEPVITLKSRMNAQNEEQMKDLAEQL
ncbi:FprA family A-type flavoprotein [uncultured Dubosiella sp.]|uniref:FprA family A-type flavoprotein n=3 Tax=uncultured Dubosiella sp. TaxID=1937011 RepID=UPI002085851D|nr:MBL fold metallo-hydrolase [uncultured Dubosiella sp.]GJM58474.1 FprA family A-type flavoprotein [Erysipelotrichaceae bacterium OPF54]